MKKVMRSGIYLILDPSMDREELMNKLEEVIQEDIAAVQIWDNFLLGENILDLIDQIVQKCHRQHIPVLINNRWDLLALTPLDGVHLDSIPQDFHEIQQACKKEVLWGITCNNDLMVVQWAENNGFNYISFCSMFPSSTANSCDLVHFDVVQDARKISNIPIYLAGGIKPENMELLNELPYSGIALVSGIMNSAQPKESIKKYLHIIEKRNETRNYK
ncbi:thiamine phosphate synthase [Aquirufa beregesia]|nr:thiamine phosphate synthase [Aquirufa beregesia]